MKRRFHPKGNLLSETPRAAQSAGPRRGLIVAVIGAGAVILALCTLVVILLLRGPGVAAPAAAASPGIPPSTPAASADPSPSSDGGTTGQPVVNPPAPAPAPAPPAPPKPAPPAKEPLKEGIISFSARPWTGKTLASSCAALHDEAASQQDAVLLTFTWQSVGLKNGGEIKVNNTYGGSDDLQNIPATGTVDFEIDCFHNDGSVKTTKYELILSNGSKRFGVEIILSADGIVSGMKPLP